MEASTLERILEVTRKLAVPMDLKSMLSEVVDAARDVLDAERGTVFLFDPAAHELVAAVATGVGELRVPADRGIVGECVRSRRVINVPDAYADPRFNREADRVSGFHTRCLLTIPLDGHRGELIGVLQLLNKRSGVFDGRDENVATALAAQCGLALQRARMIEDLVVKERQDRELAVARQIQLGFLPKRMPSIAGYDIAGLSHPADETGGDTFDFVEIGNDRLVILLGDATGHGIGPALSVTQLRAMLRMATRTGTDIGTALGHINTQLEGDLADNRFITAFLGELDAEAHHIDYHSAGQAPLMHFRAADGACAWLGSTTMPLGFVPKLKPRPAERVALAAGDIFGLMSDGVFERENDEGKQFGEDGVSEFIREHRHLPTTALAEALFEDVRAFGGGAPQADDITIVLVRRGPS